ncbi:DUF3291 domain-containing protein [Solwaraspora sp. WMMD406]|uniref:DUF3291 domain-containing protein n=1 Tax=Solwaraspora sp. WMMD406 TaxID=3016095 RepID=UPI002415AC65|nr:DUF3291 domain-containing protein [Solwaraspora sp. WMMD406]MDG4763211.1 DUF3291 domain-containing protein [Solwaraspora sp. WMMD406]
MDYHYAQFNVAWLREPLDHPALAEFTEAIDPLHDIADRTPGFVWRLKAEGDDDATALRPLGEDGIINFTVWESREAMAAWVYRHGHGAALKRRRDWFRPPLEPNVVMWWIPAGHTPTLDEAIDRLQYLRSRGPTPLAFTFRDKYRPEDAMAYRPDADVPPLGAPYIGADQARRCVDAYLAAWNEPVPDRRTRMLAQATTDSCSYVDPDHQLRGRADLVAYIDELLHRAGDHGQDRRVVRTSEVDVHHLLCRFGWRLDRPGGPPTVDRTDLVEFSRDGRIHRVTGFVGPLPSYP